MKLFFWFCSLLSLTLILSCTSSKDISKYKKDHVILSLEKEGCSGNCSVYNVRVFKNRYASYEGLVNVEKFGLYSRRLDKNEFKALTDAFDNAGFMDFQDSFAIESSDLPVIRMMYRKKEKVKTVTGSTDRPSYVLDLQQLLEKTGKSGQWLEVRKYEPKYTYKQRETTMVHGENIIENQLIVEPAEGVDIRKWVQKYSDKGVAIDRQLSANLNYWLLNVDTKKISAYELMKSIKSDPEIRHVEFNRRVSPREH